MSLLLFKIKLKKILFFFKKHEDKKKFKANIKCFYINLKTLKILKPGKNFTTSKKLPNNLLLSPNFYNFYDKIYDCRAAGIYQFVMPHIGNFQYLVLTKNDILKNLKIISLMCKRGTNDDYLTFHDLLKNGQKRPLFLTCGYICKFTKDLLLTIGQKVEIVNSFTAESTNLYNDSHTLIECFNFKNKKVVVDIDNKVMFSYKNKILSFDELLKYNQLHKKIKILSYIPKNYKNIYNIVDPITNFNFIFCEQEKNISKKYLDKWILRCCQKK